MNARRFRTAIAATTLAASSLLGTLVIASPAAHAQSKGTATIVDPGQSNVKGSFAVTSFATGAAIPATIGSATGGAGAGKMQFSVVKVTKAVDALSPALFRAMAAGSPINKVEIVRGAATYRFSSVFVTKVDVAGDDTDTETIEMAYGAMEIVSGTVRTCWSQLLNRDC